MTSVTDRKVGGLVDETVEAEIAKTKQLFSDYEKVLPSDSSQWAFDSERPTALDAHMIVFVARLLDKQRDNLISHGVLKYARSKMEESEWKETMEGRTTMPPGAA